MLHRRRAPLFSGLAASVAVLALTAAPAESQTRMPPPVQQAPLEAPGAASPTPLPAPAPAPVTAPAVTPSSAPTTLPAAVPQADPYAVSGVQVDISAANANAARDQAIQEAQTKAWAELYKRLVPGAGAPPRLSNTDLARVVQGFEIDDERVSATRYVGSITVRFRPNAVRDMLAGTTTQYVEPPSRPFVLLPVTVVDGRPILWEDRTAWRAAWEERPPSTSLVPLLVPDGELTDISAIGVQEALDGNQEALARIAQRYNAGGVVVAKTVMAAEGPDLNRSMTVDVVRYSPDGQRQEQTVGVKPDGSDRPEDFLIRATNFVGAALDQSWQSENLVASGPEQATLVRLTLNGLGDLVEARRRLATVPGLTRADVLSLNRQQAVMSLTHRGDAQALRTALERNAFALYQEAVPPLPPAGGGPAPLGGPAVQWQLSLRPDAGQPAPVPPQPSYSPQPVPQSSVQPTYAPSPYVATPGMAPGAPPRSLGTLPATGAAPRY